MPKPDLTSLPTAVRDLWRDVELRSGNNIDWRDVTECDGRMSNRFHGDIPVIECKAYTESGLTEELMHLVMKLDGFPDLWGPLTGCLKSAAAMLGGLQEHIPIFPKLRKMGYEPSAEAAVQRQLRQLEETHQPEFGRIAHEPCLSGNVRDGVCSVACRDLSRSCAG